MIFRSCFKFGGTTRTRNNKLRTPKAVKVSRRKLRPQIASKPKSTLKAKQAKPCLNSKINSLDYYRWHPIVQSNCKINKNKVSTITEHKTNHTPTNPIDSRELI